MERLGLEEGLDELRETFRTGRTRSASWRRAQLKALLSLLEQEEEAIFYALNRDLGKHRAEAYRDEVGFLIKAVNVALDGLKKWMAPEKVKLPFIAYPTTGEVVPEPLGVVLIFSSWNFPIVLGLDPLIGAISAGNAAVLKPSELAPASASFLANYVPNYLDSMAIKVFQGGQEVGEKLLEQKWDKIFFTGSPRVARIVMTAAAKNLTPVALELGGKCPAILDSLSSLSDQKVAASRIAAGKWGACCGQACIAIDYLLVEEKFALTMVDLLRTTIKKCFTETSNLSKIINKQHFLRLSSFLKDPFVNASIIHGGTIDHENQFIQPTILLDPPLNEEVMTEEIFGPILPIITLKNIEDSIDFVNARPKPLAIYVFTHNENFKEKVTVETSSGSVTFNDAIVQFACDTLPFGGVGESGFGKYHGKYSFDAFSHGKAIMRRNFFLDMKFRYPPWTEDKLKMIRALYNFDYLELVLRVVGLKRR